MPEAAKPGPRNDITDIPGIMVGQASDSHCRTGVSVILPSVAMICAGDVRGGGPGTRETDLLNPHTLVETADAIVLSGGSTYGLAAADAVATRLGKEGRGFSLVDRPGVPRSPIVPSAILYDLANGGDKSWGHNPPYGQLGEQAYEDAKGCQAVVQGGAGAGAGALAGALRGGVGSVSVETPDGLRVGALMAVNSFGSVMIPGTGSYWAWPFELDNEFGGFFPEKRPGPVTDLPDDTKLTAAAPRTNTTIGVVALNRALSQAQAQRVAIMAQDGMARAIRPIHAPTDGDVIFVLAPVHEEGMREDEVAIHSAQASLSIDPLTLTRLGNLAADCIARAIARGVYRANMSESGL